MSLVSNGQTRDWNDFDVIDFSAPWWNSNAHDNLTVAGKLPLMSGAILITEIDDTLAMVYNQSIHAEYSNIINFDIYDSVLSGNWTLDNFIAAVMSVSADLNADGEILIGDDLLGYGADHSSMAMNWPFACDFIHTSITDGAYSVEMTASMINNITTMLEKLANMFMSDFADQSKLLEENLEYFINGKLYMFAIILRNLEQMRNMEDDYGVIPYPKFDEAQEDYITHVGGASPIMLIPIQNAADDERLGTILEAMCEVSYRLVRPAYYEVSLKEKGTRDEESKEILNIILDARTYDLAYISATGPAWMIGEMVGYEETAFARRWEQDGESIIYEVQDIIDKIIENKLLKAAAMNPKREDSCLIGIDIGTQGTKTVLFDAEGNTVASAFEPSVLLYPAPGAVEQRAEDLCGSVIRTVKQVTEASAVDPRRVAAIGMDGQMAGILGIDRDFRAATPLDSWLDTRCEPYIRQMKETAEEELIRLMGCPVTYAHGPKILRWKTEFPDVYRRISKFVEPVTYVVGTLCGLKADEAYLDYTNLHFSGFADNARLRWSDALCREFGVDSGKLPRIVAPHERVGGLTKAAAERMGLAEGTPVVAGCGDQAATSLGAGAVHVGDCFDGAGTASVFSCCTADYAPDITHKTILFPRHVLPGLFQPMAYISGGGMCLKWFKSTLLKDALSYRELEEEAERVPPGSGGLFFLPHFSGRTCPNDPDVRGMFWGLNFTHDRACLFRAIMESIAFEYRYYLDILKKNRTVAEPETVYGTGGGSASPSFNRIKADVPGVSCSVTTRSDTAPFGAALLAGCGAGVTENLSEAVRRYTTVSAVYRPDPERHAAYEPSALQYAELLNRSGYLRRG